MATLVKTPNIPQPDLSLDNIHNYFNDCDKYKEQVAALAKEQNGDDPLIGEVVRWQRGDGYAEYLVWNAEPLELVHLPLGDAWTVEAPLIRGLIREDIEAEVEREKALTELFGRRKENA